MYMAPLLLTATSKPGVIVGPIASVLGVIINFIFEFVYSFIHNWSFGFTIILFTIVVKVILFPLAIKQQHSMIGMRKIQPEMKKLQDKYKGVTDPAMQQKMKLEFSELYRKNKVSPFSGCLPMLVQLPIIYALFHVIREAHTYIYIIGNIYDNAISLVMQIPNFEYVLDVIAERVLPKANYPINSETVMLILQKSTAADLSSIVAAAPGNIAAALEGFFAQKLSIEYFIGINLMQNPGFPFPGILIPILAALSTLTSSLLMNKQYEGSATNDAMQTQQKIMTWFMPIMMGGMAFTLPSGVGIYWITSSFFQTAQQAVLNKYFFQDTKKGGV